MTDDTSRLRKLGSGATRYELDRPEAGILETFDNGSPGRDYVVELVYPEFTSLCPVTGQPDFATIVVRYVPDGRCVESKSFKLYMVAYRNHRSFMETMTNKILDDLVLACAPRWIRVEGRFRPRGGTAITVTAEHGASEAAAWARARRPADDE